MGISFRIIDQSETMIKRTWQQIGVGIEAAAEVLAKSMKDTLATRGAAGGGLGSGAGGALPSSPGSPPAYQRGALHRSIKSTRATIANNRVWAYAGTDLRYGMYLERGANPRASGRALLIPLQPEAYRMLEQDRVRNNPDLFMITRPGKAPLLVRRNATGRGRSSYTPLFVLKKSVVIKARPWMKPSLDRSRVAMTAAFVRAARNAAGVAA